MWCEVAALERSASSCSSSRPRCSCTGSAGSSYRRDGGTQIDCADRFHLGPDSLVVKVSSNGRPGFDILSHRPADATPLVVGGLPAYVEAAGAAAPEVGADLSLVWTISMPGFVSRS